MVEGDHLTQTQEECKRKWKKTVLTYAQAVDCREYARFTVFQ